MPDMLFILLLALIVLGPKKLPQVAAQIGKYLAQFQRVRREVMEQVSAEMLQLEKGQQRRQSDAVPSDHRSRVTDNPSLSA